jgi:uncharacterized membrane protein YbhN (UPF0104 family)
VSQARARRKRVLSGLLAACALGFVAYAVPIRDQCVDPALHLADPAAAPKAARVAVSRDGDACILHRPTGEERLAPAACASLTCEPGLYSTLKGARIGWLALLLVAYFAGTLAWAARWRALLILAGVKVSVLATWRISLESQAGGIILPGGFGGDALRVAFVVGKGAPTATVIASVLLDRALGLVTMATIAAGLAAILGGELGPMATILASIPVAFVGGLVVMRIAYARGLGRAAFMQRGLFANVVKPVLEYVGDPRAPAAIGAGLLVSLIVSAVQLAIIRGEIVALGVTPASERWVYVGVTMAFMVSAIPALPGGWGTSDAAFVFFLGRAGLAPSSALAVSLLYRLFWYSSGGIGAVLFMMRSSRATANVAATEAAQAPDHRADPS